MEENHGLTREEVREVDRHAIEDLGIPGVVLMENAGRGAAEWLLEHRDRCGLGDCGRVGILCGKGNNAGDGFVVARHLALAGVEVVIGETVEPGELSDDAGVFRGVCAAMGLPLVAFGPPLELQAAMGQVDLWVDGLLGTGFRPPLGEELCGLMEAVRGARELSGARLVALDCPSGMDVDTGILAAGGLRADLTLTFVAPKAGFSAPEADLALGEVIVLGIGAPGGG